MPHIWWVCSTFEDVDDVTHAWSTMYDGIVTEYNNKRKAKIRTNALPWVDTCIRKLMNGRYELFKQLTKQLRHGKNIEK